MDNKEMLAQVLVAIQEQTEVLTKMMDNKIDGLRQEMTEEIKSLRSEVTDLRDEMKQEVKSLRDEMREGFKATRSEIVEAVEVVGRKVDDLTISMKGIEDVTAQNAFDVQLMKRRA